MSQTVAVVEEVGARRGWGAGWVFGAIATVAVAMASLIWPGDAPWFWDEPMEFARALQGNARHLPALEGLCGSFPMPFGAFGIHLYQIWLVFTHNPVALEVLHALFCAVPTAIALLWLSRTLKLNPWFAAAVLATPHLWFEFRRMWQPSFCIPLGALAMASHAAFLRRPGRGTLLLTIGCCLATLLIHLQGLPLAIAILGHLAWRYRSELERHWTAVATLLGAFALVHGIYILRALAILAWFATSFFKAGHNSHTPLSEAWWGPLLGGRLFAGWDWEKEIDAAPPVLVWVSSAAVPLVWMGIAVAAWRWWRGRQGREAVAQSVDAVRDRVLAVCLAGVAMHFVLCTALRLSKQQHYYFGTFGMYVVLAWIGLEWIRSKAARALLVGAYGASGAALTALILTQVHQTGWTRWLSPTLAEQVALVRRLNGYSDAAAWTEVKAYRDRESAYVLKNLRALMRPEPGEPRVYSGRLVIRYRADAPQRIELVESSSPPRDAKLVDIAPYP